MIKKFRVWDKKSCVYRDLVDFAVDGAGDLLRYVGLKMAAPYNDLGDVYEELPEGHDYTVEYYTGYNDDNGKEIYEGDVVTGRLECDGCGEGSTSCIYVSRFTGVVEHDLMKYGCYIVKCQDGEAYSLLLNKLKMNLTIIGNSHDSPKAKEE